MSLGSADFEEAERRVVDRDRAAFSTLEHAYEDVIYRFFLFKTNDRTRSSKLTSEVFVAAWDTIERYPWRDFSFHVWLIRIAKAKLEGQVVGKLPDVDS